MLHQWAECSAPGSRVCYAQDRVRCTSGLSALRQGAECSAPGSRGWPMLQLGGGGFQGVVEVLAKCIYEGSLEELIDGDAFPFSLCKGAAAERPAVKVECGHSAGEFGDADGVEAAGDGLFEGAFAQRAGSLNCAEATALLKKGIGALCSAYKGSHKVAILVFHGKALTFNLFHSFGYHIFSVLPIVVL